MADTNRGKLKLFIGYAAGVGKTYKMLEEAQALKAQGIDVVIGYFESHGRKDTIEKTEGLETVPRAKIEHRGSIFEEMDVDAILARRPHVCVVDEYAHTNVPGSRRAKRWEDVEVIRNAGINVLTTMNIQHLESLNDQVWQIAGIRVHETIPDWVVQQADEVTIVDLSPRSLIHRLERGVVYKVDKIERALQNFFKESTLVALRELALRETAHEIEHHDIKDDAGNFPEDSKRAGRTHKILLLITEDPKTVMLIRRARRVSDYLEAECFAVWVSPEIKADQIPDADREAIAWHLNFARNMRIQTRILKGNDVAQTLVDFAKQNQVTQIFLTRTRELRSIFPWNEPLPQKIVRLARDIQIVIVSSREPRPD